MPKGEEGKGLAATHGQLLRFHELRRASRRRRRTAANHIAHEKSRKASYHRRASLSSVTPPLQDFCLTMWETRPWSISATALFINFMKDHHHTPLRSQPRERGSKTHKVGQRSLTGKRNREGGEWVKGGKIREKKETWRRKVVWG